MKLFEPGKIGSMALKNRIVMAAMGPLGLNELDGSVSSRMIDYYAARARGGAGLITVGGGIHIHVDKTQLADGMWSIFLRVDNPVYISRLSQLTDAVHHYGGKVCAQLTVGLGRTARVTFGERPVAPSAVPYFWDPSITCRELTLDEITTMVRAAGKVARILTMAGFDAVELHGHAGYLLDQFTTALWNKRTDKYGGDLEGRLRFPTEIIAEIRNAVGNDLALIYRLGAKHYLEGGREVAESQEMARRLQAAGVDALHVDAGCHETIYWFHPTIYHAQGCMIDCAEAIKQAVDVPVIAVGKLGQALLAERVLQDGKADFIALARPLLADPDWPKKVKQGKLEDIRPCICDLEGCLERIHHDFRYLSCTVNPQTGMEREYALTRADEPRNVLVVGGGPAGMEAARVAALRGHRVTLWEQGHLLGGNMVPGSMPDFKADIRGLIDYFVTQLRKLRVNVELGKTATFDSVTQAKPDVVIVATGATTWIPDMAEASSNVVTAIDVLSGNAAVGERVVVAGGGITGCEVAVWLAGKGKRVTLVEMQRELIVEQMSLDNKLWLRKMVGESEVETLVGARIQKIAGDGVVVSVDGAEELIAADSVVLALGLKPRSELAESLSAAPFEVVAVGDCVKPRKIMDAIWEGFHSSRVIQ